MYLALMLACGPISLDGSSEVADNSDPLGEYELGWPIDACSTEMDDAGTGHEEGDVLPSTSCSPRPASG